MQYFNQIMASNQPVTLKYHLSKSHSWRFRSESISWWTFVPQQKIPVCVAVASVGIAI